MALRDIELPGSRRRAVNLRLQPGLQLRLPLLIFAITAGFSLMFGANALEAYGKMIELAIDEPWLETAISEQGQSFVIVSAAIGVAYVVTVFIACLAYAHRLLGPLVPIRRRLEGMKNGDYTSRIYLREGDLYGEIAEDLNELAQLLRDQEKRATAAEARS